MNPPYPSPWNTASNATHMVNSPMANGFQRFTMTAQPSPQHYPFMMMQQQPQQLHMQHPGFPMYAFPPHNYPMMAYQQPFFPINQVPVVSSPRPMQPRQAYAAAPSTPVRTKMHNTSLNASLLGSSTSFNDSVRFNPLGRGRSRDHSLLVDQTTSSSDRSFQQSRTELVKNNDLIDYCISALSRTSLTERELVTKASKSRQCKKFGVHNLTEAVSTILKTYPCFISRTVILKASPEDLQPVSKTIWKTDKRYQRSRGNKLNATMFEIPEQRNKEGGEVLSVLGDIESLKIDDKEPAKLIIDEKEN